ncbi:MAG: hypothetical protein K2N28_07590 [Muribaculaceae bacterium]|nr:hypothetical protein [Muribaculaceae bacterium]
MAKNYFKKGLMLLGAAAFVASAGAQGTYQDVTLKYMKNPAFFPGWQGAITAIADGVGEVYNGAFNLYQTINDCPAGEYTLTANAFYRCGYNEFAKENMTDGKNHNAYIYINSTKVAVEGLFDNHPDAAPNSTGEASNAFGNGEYLNTVKFTLAEAGDIVIGITNTGGYNDEWCCFDNFKLVGPNGEIALVNGDFSEGIQMVKDTSIEYWNGKNSEGKVKIPDYNKGGGVYRKTNASPYNFGQQVTLPAGKYRFSALTFLRHGGAGDYNGKIIDCKYNWGIVDTQSPKDYFDQNLYNADNVNDNAYLYVSFNEEKPTNMEWDDDYGELTTGVDSRVSLLDCWQICNGDYSIMPDNETRGTADFSEIVPAYEVTNQLESIIAGFADSGVERASAYVFANEPEKYRQYVEFEVKEDGTQVWVGLAKDANAPAQYWNPFADFKLEVLTAGASEEPNIQGKGTADDPYLIATAADLCEAHNLIPQGEAADFVYFKQTADIDMKNADYDKWQALNGWGGQYMGKFVYDGANHLIKNFTPGADRAPVDKVGGYYDGSIFGVLRGTVKNLGVIDADTKSDGNFDGAGIISDYSGQSDVAAEITNVFVTGKVAGNKRVGGMLAHAGATNTLTDVYAVVEINAENCAAGGIVGNLNGKTMEIDGGYVSATINGGKTGEVGLIAGYDSTKAPGTLTVNDFIVIGEGKAFAGGDVTVAQYATLTDEAKTAITDIAAFSEGKMFNGMPTFDWMNVSAGVDNIVVDNDDEAAPAVYYNLQGVRVENPANGLYIKKQGNKVSKVVIR